MTLLDTVLRMLRLYNKHQAMSIRDTAASYRRPAIVQSYRCISEAVQGSHQTRPPGPAISAPTDQHSLPACNRELRLPCHAQIWALGCHSMSEGLHA
jgi:hypothetical protein